MLLFCQFFHPEGLPVCVDIIQHVSVLITSEPLILPIEAQGQIGLEKLFQSVLGDICGINPTSFVVLHVYYPRYTCHVTSIRLLVGYQLLLA